MERINKRDTTLLLLGPLASILVNHYGHRVVCLSGGIISAFALLLASHSTQLWHLYLTYGVLGGKY